MTKQFSLLFISWLFIFAVNAEEFSTFKKFTESNQLSYQAVRTIAQDKQGFMWFGSQEGVHRYDGYKYLSFHHDANDPNSISSDVISRILIDRSEQIWIATRGGGLNIYQQNSQTFQHITTKTAANKLSNDNVNTLIEDSQGNIWVGTEDGLNILSRTAGSWQIAQIKQQLGNPKSLTNNTVQAIIETKEQQIWVGTNGGGISVFDLQGNFVRNITIASNNQATFTSKLINALYQDKLGDIWIGTADAGVFKYSSEDGQFISYQFDENNDTTISSNTIEYIYQDSASRVWIATDKGLLIYNPSLDNFKRINHSAINPHSLSNDFVLTFLEDNNQVIWIGTFSGVNRWDPHMTTFRQFNEHRYENLSSNLIMDFVQLDDNRILFATYSDGIYQLSIAEDEISALKLNGFFKELRIISLFIDNTSLWVGTRASGLFRVDLNDHQIEKYQHDPLNANSLSANSVTDIFKDSRNNLWVSTFHQGLNRLNSNGTFTRYVKTTPLSTNGPSSNHVLQIIEDHQGYLWLATYGGGINRFEPATARFVHLSHNENDNHSLSSDLAWIMYQDNQHNLWVGTQVAGLNLLTKESQQTEQFDFTHFNVKDGMKSQAVYGISQDQNNNIWFSSNKGISRYSAKLNSFKHFDNSHGLLDLEYNHAAVFKSADNTLYFGSAKGFISVDPNSIRQNMPAPEVRITNIFKLNEAMSFEQSLSSLTSLTFDYSDQLISFEYVGLNYSDAESTRYKYRLLGFDQQWIDAGKSRRATYTNLPAGNYTLQIIAGNNDNVWSDPGYAIDIRVNPAPWNTWWAYVLYVVFIALAVLSYTRLINRKLVIEQQQKLMLKQQVIEKTKDYAQKNTELEHANDQLEKAATIDKLTGVKSRRYLDIYIEQTSQLMNQIHQNILPVQRSILPRLYLLMIQISKPETISNSQLINLTDLLLYSRNPDDLVIRWSEDTFAIIGFEKDNNAGELAARLANRFDSIFEPQQDVKQAYSFYPFNREQAMDLSWDQVSVMVELGLNIVSREPSLNWLGLCSPKLQPFDYLQVIKQPSLELLKQNIDVKQG